MLRSIGVAVLLYTIYSVGFVATLPHPPATTAATLVAGQASYDTKFDNVDLDEVLGQERLLKNYVKCLEGVGPCTPDAKMLKETLPDAVSTDCAKCSPKQKYGSDKVTRFLIDNRPEDWARLEKLYDQQGTYRLAYLAQKAKSKEADSAAETPASKESSSTSKTTNTA